MRVCIFTDSFLPFTSGVTFAVLNQATEMSRRGHEVFIFRPRPPRRHTDGPLPPNIHLINVPFTLPAPNFPQLRLAIPTFWSSWRQLRRINPDIVHINTEWGCGWEGLVASRLLGKPVVGTFHTFFADPGYLKTIGLPPLKLIQWLMWRYSVFFFNRCRAVTSPSAAVQQSLVQQGLRRRPLVIPNGILADETPINRIRVRQLRRQHRIHGPAFVYVGRLSAEKSLDVVLRAFQIVARKRQRCSMVLIGDGPHRPALENLARELGIECRTMFLGHVDHDRLIQDRLPLMGDVFVTASKTENQPMSILEAMTMGLPIIGARAKGLPELIDHRRNGLLFEPDQHEQLARCMLWITARRGRCRRLARRASRDAAHYRMDRVVDRLERLYHQTINPQ
ncbi:MAG TPA: glycosyltransferase [Pirellulaceae bacterium]|nr:glycosyltransferase [Pirellulaceae bacterium]